MAAAIGGGVLVSPAPLAWPAAKKQSDEGTLAMAALLKERAALVDPEKLTWLVNDRRAEMFGEQLAWPRPIVERLVLRLNYVMELVKAGRVRDGLAAMEALEEDAEKNAAATWPAARNVALLQKALAYLRLGEEENCHLNSTRDSCLFPIRKGGVHQMREGSTKAIEVLQAILATAPDNLEARWLLNVAHMTLGSYPEGVPKAQLIPPSAFASDYPLSRFVNVAREVGVDFVGCVKGVVADDYDDDGRPDIYVSVRGGSNLLFHNDGPAAGGAPGWRFTDVAGAAHVTEPKDSFGAFFFDYDNDGWPDLFVAAYGPAYGSTVAPDVAADFLGLPNKGERLRLYHNRGAGTFEDVTREAGLYKVIPTMGLNFGDLDNDGWLDFYLGTGSPEFSSLIPNRMFRNAGGRSFQDVTAAGGFGHLQKGHAIAFGDVNDDGAQDVFSEMGGAYLADESWSALYLNPGGPNHWLGLELEGVRSNRKAIGARVEVALETKAGPRVLYRTVGSGGSFGASPLRLEIGLGEARKVTSVEIRWPGTGRTQTVRGLSLDRRYRVREGVDVPALLPRRPGAYWRVEDAAGRKHRRNPPPGRP